jgi:putative ABC transport system substrate-binding protein
MKKLTALLLAFVVLSTLGGAIAAEKTYRVGIAQFAVHGSLDNCREGFIQGLAEAGFKEGKNLVIEYQNAQADMGIAAGIAAAFVDTQVDLICAIATPMAIVCNNASDGKIPVIYSAVSAPIEAGLANAQGLGEGNTTGTSDLLPVRQQLETIRAMQPEAKVIGILYTLGEINSQVQLKLYQEMAGEFGFTIEPSGISAGPDIALALPALLTKVDLLTMLTDNTVVQYLDTVLDATDAANIAVYGSEIEQVLRGCVAAEGLDYLALGRQTGALAARVLNGEDAAGISFELIQESALYYNAEACRALGITIPPELLARGREAGK